MGLKPLKTLVCLVFPKKCLVFFGVLWYVWFSRKCFLFSKNLRENQTKKQKTYPRVGLKPLKTVFFCFPEGFLWFSLVFFGFPEGSFGLLKTFGKTKKKTYPRVSLKPLKTLVVWFSRCFFWFSLVSFGIFGFPEAFSRWTRCLDFRY